MTEHSDDTWPIMGEAAFLGLAGEVIGTISPHTEADAAALLISLLVAFGSAVGAGPHIMADGARHVARLFAVVVGRTSRARKGTSWRHIATLMESADATWSKDRIMSGLSTGEGLIAAVSDGQENAEGVAVGSVQDKRLLVIEEEFSRVLDVKAREHNTLSALIRQSWDTGDLRVMTKKPQSATGGHISILGHITVEELRGRMTGTDRANGFANRFLFVLARRSKDLPNGGDLADADVAALGRKIASSLKKARKIGRVQRTTEADDYWDALYRDIVGDETGGLVGAITDRGEAQVLRLSLIYALLEGSDKIEVTHLLAAEAVWRYCSESVAHVFGDAVDDPDADKLLAAIRAAGPEGLDGTGQQAVFRRHIRGNRLAEILRLLEAQGKIITASSPTNGRMRRVSVATEAIQATEGDTASPSSLSSLDEYSPEGRPIPNPPTLYDEVP